MPDARDLTERCACGATLHFGTDGNGRCVSRCFACEYRNERERLKPQAKRLGLPTEDASPAAVDAVLEELGNELYDDDLDGLGAWTR